MVRFTRNLGIRTKILLCASIILLTIFVSAGIVYNEIVQNQARTLALLRTTQIIHSIESLQSQLTTIDISARSYMLSGNDVFLDPYAHAYFESSQLRETLQEQIKSDPDHTDLLDEINRQIEVWRNDFLIPGINARTAQVQQITTDAAVKVAERAAKRAFDRLQVRLNSFRNAELEHVSQREQEAQQSAVQLQKTLIICMVFLIIGSIGTFWLLASSIAKRVWRVTEAATQMAQGNLNSRCQLPPSQDEVGQMAQAFNTMAAALQEHANNLQIQYRAAEEAREDAEQAHDQVMAQLATIEEQQGMIRQMSVPVLPLDGRTLIMPLVGALDNTRLELVQEQALQALERASARQLILDVTAVPVVDTEIARGLLQVTQMARLLGAEVFVVGIRPEVAQALVSLNIDYAHIKTYATLQQGIADTIGANARQPSQRRRS